MVYQPLNAGYVCYEAQSGLGVPAAGAGAVKLRFSGGRGGKLSKTPIDNPEVRADGMSTRGRHGTQRVNGEYEAPYILAGMDQILQAVLKGTWEAPLVLTQADFTSITTTTGTIVLASGNPVTLGIRVGDVIRLTGHSTAGNNSKNLLVRGASNTSIFVEAGSLANDAVADTSVTITRVGRKLIQPATPIDRYFTIEEYLSRIDASRTYSDCIWSGIRFTMGPNRLLMANPSFVGTGQADVLDAGAGPYFTGPTEITGTAMSVVDASVRFNDAQLLDLTGLDISITNNAMTPEIAFDTIAPDVFTGQMQINVSITALMQDLAYYSNYLHEDVLQLHIVAVDNEAEPKDFLSIYMGNFTLGDYDESPFSKEAGPKTQTITIPPALVGMDDSALNRDVTMVKIQTSNSS